jgi:hypothetical protein
MDLDSARHRLLEGFVLRLALQPDADAFVLRGGMLLRQWFPSLGRPALDLDLMCALPFDPQDLRQRLRAVLAHPLGDGVTFNPARFRLDTIWANTPAPGLRLFAVGVVDEEVADLRVDVTFGLRPWPEPGWEEFVGERGRAQLRMCRPESIVGRKLQVIVGLGPQHWRPKDLHDLRVLGRLPLQSHVLGEALEASLEGCAQSWQDVSRTFAASSWWGEPQAVARWHRFLQTTGDYCAPADLSTVLTEIHSHLQPILGDP